MDLDACSFWYAVIVGLLLFAILYFVRRIVNWYRRRDAKEDDDSVPEKLGWDLDHTDRNFIRAALAASLLTLLICWVTNHNKTDEFPNMVTPTLVTRRAAAGRDGIFEPDAFLETPRSEVSMRDIETMRSGEDAFFNALERMGNDPNMAERVVQGVNNAFPVASPEMIFITPDN